MKHIYTSMDIGTDTIKIVVCELYHNKLNLLASSTYPARGIKKGLITDIGLATESVRGALKEIEDTLGIKIRKLVTNIPSFNAEYQVIKGSVEVKSEDGLVTSEDIVASLENAAKNAPYTLREMVTILPVDYNLDDKHNIKNPKGMVGKVLDSRAILATTPRKNVYSVVSLLEGMGIEIVDISLNNIGDFYSFNNKKFEDKIGAIINIGHEITTVSLYNKGIIVKSSIINLGGKNIDQDISNKFRVDFPTAVALKTNFALASKNYASVDDVVEVKSVNDAHYKVNQYEVSKLIEERLIEILDQAKKEINLLTSREIDYIIITGGMSNMKDIEYVVNDVFDENANIGNVKMLGIRDNRYSACVGNIVFFISKLKLKSKNYTMINDNEMYQVASLNSKKNTQENMLGKIFGFFFSDSE